MAWADFIPGEPLLGVNLVLGHWDLSVSDYDSGPLRHVRLRQFLSVLQPDLIMFESVKYVPPKEIMAKGINAVVARVATAAELLGGFKTTLTTWAEENGVPAQGLAITEIKKFATGKGNANKVDMILAANEKFGTDFDPETYEQTGVDNIVDAAFVCTMGLENYSEGLA